MFSLDRFYHILHDNLVSQFNNAHSRFCYPFGTYEVSGLLISNEKNREFYYLRNYFHCYFFDQEPYYDYSLELIKKSYYTYKDSTDRPNFINILANSEKSDLKKDFIKSESFYDWYYFFHGFAALDWYRDFQYMNTSSFNRFDKVFICYNHLISKYRSYRLHLVSNLIDQDLIKHGHVSLFLKDTEGTWQEELVDPQCLLDTRAKLQVQKSISQLSAPLIIDTDTPCGSMSADVNLSDLTRALWHVVTETVYFLPKLHLTEKIFKPIVARRPFILVAAPGNLAYLKSYGFRTFDRWIDESYDDEPDHYIRIEKITAEIARLCSMSPAQLNQMHAEMQEVLDYNFDHFYHDFKISIVNELVDNFAGVLGQINNGRIPNNHSRHHQRFELSPEYLVEVKKRLSK
jgi:hypothetical protein